MPNNWISVSVPHFKDEEKNERILDCFILSYQYEENILLSHIKIESSNVSGITRYQASHRIVTWQSKSILSKVKFGFLVDKFFIQVVIMYSVIVEYEIKNYFYCAQYHGEIYSGAQSLHVIPFKDIIICCVKEFLQEYRLLEEFVSR